MMSSCDSKSKVKRKKAKVGTCRDLFRSVCWLSSARMLLLLFCLFTFAFLLSSCRRDMQDQPKAIAYRENTFFRDGLSSRTLVPGTVPRGYLRADREFYLGKKANSVTVAAGQPTATQTGGATTSAAPTSPA